MRCKRNRHDQLRQRRRSTLQQATREQLAEHSPARQLAAKLQSLDETIDRICVTQRRESRLERRRSLQTSAANERRGRITNERLGTHLASNGVAGQIVLARAT